VDQTALCNLRIVLITPFQTFRLQS